MKRLSEKDINSPQEYDRIWKERQEKGVNWFDKLRWKLLVRRFKGGKLIDLGVLDSQVPFLAKKKYPKSEIWGLDYAPELIKFMSKECPEINWVKGDVYDTLFPDNYFDYAVAGELIEHLESPEKFFKEAFRILRPGGCLVVSTPMEEEIEPGAVDGDRHLWSFSKKDLQDLLYPHGFTTIKVLGSQYFPVYKYAFPSMISYTYKK